MPQGDGGDSPRRGRRRQSKTVRVEQRPGMESKPKDRCTLTMLTGPSPGAIRTLSQERVLHLGRDEEMDWHLEDRGISGEHARIFHDDGGAYHIEDLDSTNGTYVNGFLLDAPYRLRDGDRIQLGENTLLRVSLQDETEQAASKKLYEAAVLDPLTGLYNRGHLDRVLVAEFAFAIRHRQPLSVIFVDLDHFTKVNNTYGHQAGDAALRSVAQAVANAVRTEDLAARYGGEEFVLVARGIDMNGGIAMAERVRRIVEGTAVAWQGAAIQITASFGVATWEAATPYESLEQLVAAADSAVYRAKAEGRNRVCSALDAMPESWRAR